MFFVFVDEAGTPGFTNGKKPEGYFTLAGMVVKGDNILKLEKELRTVKNTFDIHPNEEFKWSGKYKNVGFSFEQYCEFRTKMIDLINEYSMVVISSVLDKKESYSKNYINNHIELYQQALYLIMERLHLWIEGLTTKEPVVFVFDSRKNNKTENLDEKIAEAYRRAKHTGTYYYQHFPYFSETPYFSSSSRTAGLQLADYCAGPIHQYFSTGKDEWYQKLRPKIRKSPTGYVSGFGIKTFPFYPTIPL